MARRVIGNPAVDTPRWVPRLAVDAIHFEQLNEHGGGYGLRDQGALDSALARPQHKHAYQEDADLADLAASYAFGIVRSHPFVDGNTRTGFAIVQVFLGLNGHELETTDDDAADTFMALADGKLSERKLAEWIRQHMQEAPPDATATDVAG